jgi:hypothetical protein
MELQPRRPEVLRGARAHAAEGRHGAGAVGA